jgi:hypothetical protein
MIQHAKKHLSTAYNTTYSLRLRGQRVSQERNQHEAGSKQTVTRLYSITFQKIKVFIDTAVRTSNPTGHSLCVLLLTLSQLSIYMVLQPYQVGYFYNIKTN